MDIHVLYISITESFLFMSKEWGLSMHTSVGLKLTGAVLITSRKVLEISETDDRRASEFNQHINIEHRGIIFF